jgi:transcriptional regulator with AAA-type ATPase domain/pSer/pThr/pTyr-binding forkhead associated (FHA) protein
VPVLFFHDMDRFLFEHRLRSGRTAIGRSDRCDIALPGESISRVHFLVEHRSGSWNIVDRSKHGTLLNGAAADRCELADGDEIQIGTYRIGFREGGLGAGSTADAVAPQSHSFMVSSSEDLRVLRAELRVTGGPGQGKTLKLRQGRASIGSAGSDIEISDPTLLASHCRLRIARGRAMAEPGTGPVYLDGRRIAELTPVYEGESLRIGDTLFQICTSEQVEDPRSESFGGMSSESAEMQRVFGRLRRFAAHAFPVLLLGESGTGKELAARGIHDCSPRSSGPFVALNCGAIPEGLLESELFGHEKGAFTGAAKQRDGAFQQAGGGTLFLDELGELPIPAQVKLLRCLESGEVRRVGGGKPSFPDVRIVAATSRNLASRIHEGLFRQDLLYRLNVLSVELPPLRMRKQDIGYLARLLARQLHPKASIAAEAFEMLGRHHWPGNVRELRNVVIRAYVLGGPKIEAECISFFSLEQPIPPAALEEESEEQEYLAGLMRRHGGNRAAVAREMGIARSTLLYRLKKLQID